MLTFHHIGIACRDIEKTKPFYLMMGYTASPVVEDPLQHVRICFLEKGGAPRLELLEPADVAEEMRLFLSNVDSEGTVFRANHASNYITLKGTLNRDIPEMLAYLDRVRAQGAYRPEGWRRL